MGIDRNVAAFMVREHAWRPIRGDVLLLGRQTMLFTPDDAIAMLRVAGLRVPEIAFSTDSRTRLANRRYINDTDFFRLLEVPRIRALDVSDYEGADLIHDLTQPVPPGLEAIADFILDGSTLDNVFDPATALRNIARMLRPGGRLVSVNVASNHYVPYTILTAAWLLDFFVVNAFADCKVYVLVYGPSGANVFTPDLRALVRDRKQPENFTSDDTMALLVLAEKGAASTWHRTPVQHQYRSDWQQYEQGLRAIVASPRPHHARSTTDRFVERPDFLFIDPSGGRVAPGRTLRLRRAIARIVPRLLRL